MDILLLNYEFPPLGAGAGVISKHIAEGLSFNGNHVTVVSTWFDGEPEREESGTLTIIRLKSKRKYIYKSNIFEMLSWIKESKKFLIPFCLQNHFDIAFANFSIPGGDVAYYLKQKLSLPYVVISHGHDIPWFFPSQMLAYHILTYRWIKRICLASELNFVQSAAMKKNIDKFTGKGNESKNVVIINGSDFDNFKPDYSKQAKSFKIIFVGRLVKQKDPFTFLKAIKLFAMQNNDFTAHVIGDGPLRKEMEYYVNRNNLWTKVFFTGWLPKDQLLMEYQSSHIKIAPSLEEGMSISIMESIACGQYVLTTPVSENSALIQEQLTGEIVKLRDYKEIAMKLQKFYDEKFMQGYIIPDEYLEKHKDKYGWKGIVDAYERELLKALEKRRLS